MIRFRTEFDKGIFILFYFILFIFFLFLRIAIKADIRNPSLQLC